MLLGLASTKSRKLLVFPRYLLVESSLVQTRAFDTPDVVSPLMNPSVEIMSGGQEELLSDKLGSIRIGSE